LLLKNRLFISLNLPDSVVGKIISLRDTVAADENIKWEPIEKLHLTIKFIGDVSNELMDIISEELMFLINYTSLNCSVNKFGFFYRDKKPTILIASLSVDEKLDKIIAIINENLQKFNIPAERRKLNPHITLLRVKNDLGINFVNSFKKFTFKPILFNTNSITLYKSILHPEGSEYIKIKNYKLKELE
jgi:2'-5' RNA ligase